MYNLNRKQILLTATLVLSLAACKKLDLAPSDRFTELTFWQSNENVANFLNNVYGGMYSSQTFFYSEALTDNAVSTRNGNTSGQADIIAGGNFTSTLPRFGNEWAFYYGGIKSANIFLDNLDKNTTLTGSLKERYRAEARFIRAFHYANLTNLWGDVPLLKNDISADDAKSVARTPKADVISFIISELDAVTAALPKKEEYGAADRGRITRGAALALKARVLLYQGNRMQEVVAACEALIDNGAQNGQYALVPAYSDVFSPTNEYNSEVILDLQYAPVTRTWNEFIDFAPISAGARSNNMAPTQELVDSYIMLNGRGIRETGSGYNEANPYVNRDPRLAATIVFDQGEWKDDPAATARTIYITPGSTPAGGSNVDEYNTAGQGTPTGYFWRKYYDHTSRSNNYSSGLNLILIRYADVLLMYAEAKNALGGLDAATWDKTIGALRRRAGFSDPGALNFPSASTASLTEIIRRERRSELAMEGRRFDDIRRWGLAETVLNGWAHGARYGDPAIDNGYLRVQQRGFNSSRNYLWPVPESERALNSSLTQNPNY
ncbi:MAG TPA: RagB/SusD family nutrient uptake outer membrane protein [Flavisolibacter sp.]|nr:RagB/SusD family nutrient uptake outer membrane protein [Flavisolibacter sp.]